MATPTTQDVQDSYASIYTSHVSHLTLVNSILENTKTRIENLATSFNEWQKDAPELADIPFDDEGAKCQFLAAFERSYGDGPLLSAVKAYYDLYDQKGQLARGRANGAILVHRYVESVPVNYRPGLAPAEKLQTHRVQYNEALVYLQNNPE